MIDAGHPDTLEPALMNGICECGRYTVLEDGQCAHCLSGPDLKPDGDADE